jgi:hypothetical protein
MFKKCMFYKQVSVKALKKLLNGARFLKRFSPQNSSQKPLNER